MELGRDSRLRACGRCEKLIPVDAEVCAYCGRHQAGSRRAVIVGGAVAVFLAVGLLSAVQIKRGGDERVRSGSPAEAPAEETAVINLEPWPTTPDTAGSHRSTPPAPASTPGQPLPQETPSSPTLVVRWTRDWVNLREGRGVGTRVLGVYPPGTRLEVRNQQSGWWEVYVGGALAGYVAGSELSSEPTGA
jgi:hypothetical protein